MNRLVMDSMLKPFVISSVGIAGKMFKEDVPATTRNSRLIADCFDEVIAYHTMRKDQRMIDFYKGLRNITLQIYENDSFYTHDFETVLRVMAKNKDILNRS